MNEPKKRGRPTNAERAARQQPDAAQTYALRVWNGCSVSLPDVEKEKIVREALQGQGWTMEGIELP